MDEVIDRELEGLRAPVESVTGLANAIRDMRAPASVRNISMRWPIGVGSAAALAGIAIFVGSLTTTPAFAGELKAIISAQKHQQTIHQKSIMYGDNESVILVMETWRNHSKEAFRQFSAQGKLEIARLSDGKQTYHFVAPNSARGFKPYGSIEPDDGSRFDVGTLDSILSSKSFVNQKVEKKANVLLDGRRCDYYSIARGYYRVWVDPVTKLPVRRDIYDKGVTLWKRDFYDYPTSFAAKTFEPYWVEGLTYLPREIHGAESHEVSKVKDISTKPTHQQR